MAPYVNKTFQKEYKDAFTEYFVVEGNGVSSRDTNEREAQRYFDELPTLSNTKKVFTQKGLYSVEILTEAHEYAIERATTRTDRACYQAMEALVHNLNTMHCLPSYEKLWVYDTQKKTLDLLCIEDLYVIFEKNRYQVISLNRNTMQTEFKSITHVTRKDRNRRLIEVETAYGQKACTTDNHLWLTNVDGRVVDKKPEDVSSVIMPRSIPMPDSTSYIKLQPLAKIRSDTPFKADKLEITESLAELLGYYVADGSVISGSSLSFSTYHKVDYDRLVHLVKECFGDEVSYQYYPRIIAGVEMRDHRFNVGTYLARNIKDICGDGAEQKKVPNEIMISSDKKIRLAFLNAYFSCDAKVCGYIEATSVSRLLIKQLHFMLLSFGIVPKYSTAKCGRQYRLVVPGLAASKIGLKLKKTPKFELQREDLDYAQKRLRSKYQLAWFKDLTHRHTKNGKNQIRYDETIEACKKHGIDFNADEILKTINVITIPADTTSTSNSEECFVYDLGVEENENFMTEDGLFVHNSRAGAQVPFSSLNYGTDTSPEGRMVVKNLLLATQAGLGNGETPIFPVQIFKVKEGVNYNEGDPNYDLFKLAMETSAKRLFPNFSFLDAPFNKAFYTQPGDWDKEVAYMGCRTRVMANVDKEHEVTCGRGNISFTTINLPRLGIMAGEDIDFFFALLDDRIDLVIRQLLHRYKIQGRRKVKNYPFLMGNGIWIDSDKLDWDDPIESVIRHGTLTIGFIGLAECLIALTGHHHGESTEAQEFGLKIIGHMRKRCDDATEAYKLNFSLIATPSESTCFAKGTLVQGLHGNKPIEEVKPGDVLFSYNEENGHIELDTVEECWMTSPSRKVLKITFDNGQEITCTPDHLFGRRVLIQGEHGQIKSKKGQVERLEWVKAGDLKPGMRLKSNYITESGNGYMKASASTSGGQFVHKMAYEFFSGEAIPDGYVVHHKDGNKQNNVPKNLEMMSDADHRRLHMPETIRPFCHTSESVKGEKNPFFGKRHSDASKAKMRNTLRQLRHGKHPANYVELPGVVEKYKAGVPVSELMKQYGVSRFPIYARLRKAGLILPAGAGYKTPKTPTEDLLSKFFKGFSIREIADYFGESYQNVYGRLARQGVLEANHVVVKVEEIDESCEVWDITMTKNHTFYVGGDQGILVHNCGKFPPLDRKLFGEIEGINDRLYYTNSFHVPVYYPIKAFKKIQIEAPYHELTNGGHITYVELAGDTARNLDAFEKIVRYMHDCGIGYGSINHPVDRDPVCGYVGVIGDVCPRCGRKEGESIDVEKLRELRKKYPNVPKY